MDLGDFSLPSSLRMSGRLLSIKF